MPILMTPFIQSGSQDPVERAFARRIVRVLNGMTLDRRQRELLVRTTQSEWIAH